MALGDLYEASIIQDYSGEEVINVFHFEHISTSGDAVDLITRIINQWITANWETLITLALSFVEIAVRNLFNSSDQATLPVGIAGDSVIDGLPPHDVIRATFTPDDLAIRKGRKAFSGSREDYGNEGVLSPTTVTLWQDFVDDHLTQPLLGTPEPRYHYAIVQRVPYTTVKGNPGYRLPENVGEAVFSQVQSGLVGLNLRTQGSRDYEE